MDAPQSSVDTLKEHAYKHGLKDGTTWLRQLLEFDPSHDSFIPIAARNAIAKRAEYVEHGFDFEKMQHITRELLARQGRQIKHAYMAQLLPELDEHRGSENE